jgi:hypothetical protein
MNRKAAAFIGAVALGACSSGGEQEGVAAPSPEACAQRFVEMARLWPAHPGAALSLNYLFEAPAESATLLKNGLEGIKPDISAALGDGADRLADEAAGKALGEDERPRLIYYAQQRPRIVYAPERAFSPDEARAHILEMCRLRDQGLVLRQVHLFVKAKGS